MCFSWLWRIFSVTHHNCYYCLCPTFKRSNTCLTCAPVLLGHHLARCLARNGVISKALFPFEKKALFSADWICLGFLLWANMMSLGYHRHGTFFSSNIFILSKGIDSTGYKYRKMRFLHCRPYTILQKWHWDSERLLKTKDHQSLRNTR